MLLLTMDNDDVSGQWVEDYLPGDLLVERVHVVPIAGWSPPMPEVQLKGDLGSTSWWVRHCQLRQSHH